ncbi:MAG: hypothetical protein ACHREM_03985 [Polyangiales bacterium]
MAGEVFEQGRATDVRVTAKKVALVGVTSAGRAVATRGVEIGLEVLGRQMIAEGARQTGRAVARQTAKSAMRGNALTAVAALIVEQGLDTYRLAAGDIDGDEYGRRSVENVGSSGGGLGGAAAGAALGTAICPGVGTIVGGFIGGLLGGLLGNGAARTLVRA